MKSMRCRNIILIGNQLPCEGDRHVWPGRLGLGKARPAGHAGGASLQRHPGAQGLPPKGGHPTPQGAVRAHRSSFEQARQRHGKVVLLERYAASRLLGLGVGVRVKTRPHSALQAFQGKIFFIVGGEVGIERTPSGLRPAVDVDGAGAPALMRAPALFCCMGFRP